MTRQRMKFGLFGGGIFLAGLLAGAIITGVLPAFAARGVANSPKAQAAVKATPSADYCQLYINTLASELKIDPATLAQDNQKALVVVLDQMQKDGKITAFEKTQIEQQVGTASNGSCANAAKALHSNQGALMQTVGPLATSARSSLITAVAPKLGVSTATLQSDLAAGQTIKQIAAAQNVSLTPVSAAYLNTAQSELSLAVNAGYITQDQSSAIYTALQKATAQGHFPLLDPGQRGMMS